MPVQQLRQLALLLGQRGDESLLQQLLRRPGASPITTSEAEKKPIEGFDGGEHAAATVTEPSVSHPPPSPPPEVRRISIILREESNTVILFPSICGCQIWQCCLWDRQEQKSEGQRKAKMAERRKERKKARKQNRRAAGISRGDDREGGEEVVVAGQEVGLEEKKVATTEPGARGQVSQGEEQQPVTTDSGSESTPRSSTVGTHLPQLEEDVVEIEAEVRCCLDPCTCDFPC